MTCSPPFFAEEISSTLEATTAKAFIDISKLYVRIYRGFADN